MFPSSVYLHPHPRVTTAVRGRIIYLPQRYKHSGEDALGLEVAKRPRGNIRGNLRKQLTVYSQLSKARLSSLVVMSAGAGFLLAGTPVAVDTLAALCVGTYLTAFSANTFNQLYERHTDKLMKRTRARPLPSGRITPQHALGYGVATGVGGVGLLALTCNPLTTGLGAANILLYALVYTPMKRQSVLNTWVGSVVGAIPPLMGYAAATGTICSAEAGILAAGLYLWQFPHFFSLAWLNKQDYSAGGHHMVPCFDTSGEETADLLTRYSVYMSTLPLAAYALGITGSMFALESVAFNGYLLWACHRFEQDRTRQNARRVFLCSLWYLPLFMALLIFHKKRWGMDGDEHYNPNLLTLNGMDVISRSICDAKEVMKGWCLHEVIVDEQRAPSRAKSKGPAFCPHNLLKSSEE